MNSEMNSEPSDILILSNGPGEVTTWVRPVVQELKQQLPQARISVILAPCANATGTETQIVRAYAAVDRVQEPAHFFRFLLWGKTAENWDWRPRGGVVFLGGDQLFAAIAGKRLGYQVVVYAEWEARWWRWVDGFGAMNERVRSKIPQTYRHKCWVVGDLMLDVNLSAPTSVPTSTPLTSTAPTQEIVAILPGSKAMKLTQGVPLVAGYVEAMRSQRPQTRVVLPVAPTLDLPTLAKFGDPDRNPVARKISPFSLKLVQPENGDCPYLETSAGTKIELWTEFPAHHLLAQCRLCITTIGANTAELGALGIPMIVVIPTQQIDAMRAWDGLPGLMANLPWVGFAFAWSFNLLMYWLYQRKRTLWAWPNIWAGEEVVPEIVRDFTPEDLAQYTCDFLEHPETLAQMQAKLRQLRGEAGAAKKLVALVRSLLY